MGEIEFIEGREELGIKYDLNKIYNLFKKLKVPSGLFKPPVQALQTNKYIIELSSRSTGKTTMWLLFGLCMNSLYGTQIAYIRQKESMTAPTFAEKLVDVIATYDNGRYIKILTDGKFNSIYYHWKKFYYCSIDENGKIVEKSEKPIIQLLSIDKNLDYKSSLNMPLGDFILFDEFLSKYYQFNEAIDFFDLCSTIIRQRRSPWIVMLANTIKVRSNYFEELMIQKQVISAKKGIPIQITTEQGTKIYFEIIDRPFTNDKHEHNRLFFGFNNPKLASITGSATWAFEQVQHIPKVEHKIIEKRLYMQLSTYEYLQIEVVDINGSIKLFVHSARDPKFDSIVLTLTEDRTENNLDCKFLYGMGNSKIHDLIMTKLAQREVYYSTNEVGYDFKNYIRQAKENPYSLE